MPRKKVRPTNKSILNSKDLLRDKIYKNGSEKYFILFPYNNPDLMQIFKGKILMNKTNKDGLLDYVMQIINGFDKREVLRNFFYENWFRTMNDQSSYKTWIHPLNDSVQMFNYLGDDILNEITDDKEFKYGKYKTFFNTHGNKFIFYVSELFVFETFEQACLYYYKLSSLSMKRYIKNMHDISISTYSNVVTSEFYCKHTTHFVDSLKPMIIKMIKFMGPRYSHYLEDTGGIYAFFNDVVLEKTSKKVKLSKYKSANINRKTKSFKVREGEYLNDLEDLKENEND